MAVFHETAFYLTHNGTIVDVLPIVIFVKVLSAYLIY